MTPHPLLKCEPARPPTLGPFRFKSQALEFTRFFWFREPELQEAPGSQFPHTTLTQRAQRPLIKEYSLSHNMKAYIIQAIFLR